MRLATTLDSKSEKIDGTTCIHAPALLPLPRPSSKYLCPGAPALLPLLLLPRPSSQALGGSKERGDAGEFNRSTGDGRVVAARWRWRWPCRSLMACRMGSESPRLTKGGISSSVTNFGGSTWSSRMRTPANNRSPPLRKLTLVRTDACRKCMVQQKSADCPLEDTFSNTSRKRARSPDAKKSAKATPSTDRPKNASCNERRVFVSMPWQERQSVKSKSGNASMSDLPV
mmetsp:Transcript_85851/g.247765  ORF Transcript_85851/g.247765 Transcript_85851/m.247765 type:complete len:228 (-) Transcript_85851:178-861(-)